MTTPAGSAEKASTETTNYEISNTTTTTVKEAGEIKRLAVSVAVDVVADRHAQGGHARLQGLTQREIEIFLMLAKGTPTRLIAQQLCISAKTVSNYLTLLKSKLQVSSHAELVHLRVRVIALENLVVALLAEGSERQREVAREMAEYISPRPGFTQHPLTLHAAQQMVHSVERAERFQRREDPAG